MSLPRFPSDAAFEQQTGHSALQDRQDHGRLLSNDLRSLATLEDLEHPRLQRSFADGPILFGADRRIDMEPRGASACVACLFVDELDSWNFPACPGRNHEETSSSSSSMPPPPARPSKRTRPPPEVRDEAELSGSASDDEDDESSMASDDSLREFIVNDLEGIIAEDDEDDGLRDSDDEEELVRQFCEHRLSKLPVGVEGSSPQQLAHVYHHVFSMIYMPPVAVFESTIRSILDCTLSASETPLQCHLCLGYPPQTKCTCTTCRSKPECCCLEKQKSLKSTTTTLM